MKKTIAILLASTALIAVIGLPAWSAIRGAVPFERLHDKASATSHDAGAPPVLVSNDDSVGRDHERRLRRGDDNDHDEGDEEDDDDDDGGNASGPAPAGSVAPPNNGLFGTGAMPKVQVN
ncbi:hypothetical protein [Mesorhizobium sp.]|uniref:hypothetical protein n=1 Tax=Mesorhizobium sp. TaxID=1871066 RepID=UPI000FE6CD8B|nr:hypothetical protein [Mesorhizobium sp.]RWM28130.1 MAG: hypothetical protein EOR74_10050 [Mesorhizobium sp.]RWM41376.1 MAG: hypothetical protein EOR75_04570 [Mesorhizobium sp.]TIO75053.1 MAG: hypothetical protein E5X75_21135 [Mesorhizobium sp.]TIO87478.1 MAG: hypothetical protein E5X74_00180 [Mesorhizobium sp.]TJV54411.1 MAG: hypothetical protein E5Y01_02765 [Mesorhizobium sp.]